MSVATQGNSEEAKQWQADGSNMLSLQMVLSGCYRSVAWKKNNVHTKGLQKGRHLIWQKEEQLPIWTVLSSLILPVLVCQLPSSSGQVSFCLSSRLGLAADIAASQGTRNVTKVQKHTRKSPTNTTNPPFERHFNKLDISTETASLVSECLHFLYVCLGMDGVG